MFEMCYTGVIAIVALFLLRGGESQVSFNRTTPSGMQSVCPNATVVFTCRISISESSSLAWTSAEYIGSSPARFTSNTMEGATVNVNLGVTELTQNSNGILESELRIRASVNSAIRCRPDNANSGVTVNLTVYNDFPGRPTDAVAVEIGSLTDDICNILVDWDPPTDTPREDIDHYIVRDSVNGDREEIITNTMSTLITFQLSQCPSSLLISIAVVDRCGREGPRASGIEPNFLPTGATMDSTTNTPSDTANTSPTIIASIVVVLSLFVIAIIVMAVVIHIFRSRQKTRQSTGDELHELLEHHDSIDDQPKYDEDDFKRIRYHKQPKVLTQAQEQDIKMFMSDAVILLHTVKEEEMVAVYDRLKPPFDLECTLLYQISTDIEVTLGIFGNHKAALIRTSKVDNCQNEITHALKSLPQVQLIIAVGFACGKRDKCKLGDVLVSTAIDGVSNDGIDEIKGFRRTTISEKARSTFAEKRWIDFFCTSDGDRESEIRYGVVVSAPVNRDSLKKLIDRHKKFIGGEMVGQELAQLTSKDGEQHSIDFIVIKGVADFSDGTEKKDWQFTATLAAATFAEKSLEETQNQVYRSQHELPRYDEHDVDRIRDDKRPQVATQEQEQGVKIFMSDVVILLHTVKEEEMVAVYNRLEPPFELEDTLLYRTSTEIEITLGMFGNHKAALIRTSKVGDCQNEITHALKSLPQVQLIIAVGFACGKRDKCELGDVLVSTTVDGVNNVRIDESGKIKIDEGSIRHTEISAKAEKTFTKRKWIDFVCTSNGERDSEIYCGVVVSSPVLLNNRVAFERLIARQKRYIGGEMEGQKLAQLIHHKDGKHHNIDFIVIKGVADFGDGKKEKDWQFTASLAAATFAERRLEETQNRVYYLQEQTQYQIDRLQHVAGVENAEHYKAYKAALEGGKVVTLRYLRFLLIGVPRSGKSTMRRRMLQEIVNLSSLGQPSVSTGVAETYDVLVKKLTSLSATISDSKWAYLKKGLSDASQADGNDEGDLHYLTHLFYNLISKPNADAATDISRVEENNTTTEATAIVARTGRQQETTDTTVESVADDYDQKDVSTSFGELSNIHSPEDLHRKQETSTDTTVKSIADKSGDSDRSPEDFHRQQETTNTTDIISVADESGEFDQREIDAAFNKLTNILQSDSPEDLHRLLEALTLINLMDVGGQPEFLDMLPALTIGAALYLLFFRLDRNLHKHYPVTYLAPGDTSEKTLETSYCIEEVIHQALASIACFSGQLSGEKADSVSSRAVLIGTYKDKVKADDIALKEKAIREEFLNVEVYKHLLLKTQHDKPFFAVDNMKGTDESEMSQIRSNIENIVKKCFAEVPIPASWLMFRVVLQLLDKPVVALSQCEEIARRLSMPTRVQEALWFFHHNIGSLLYYPDIPSVKDLVMCTPQVIFDSVTTVIIDKFKHGNHLSSAAKEQFQQMGLFSLSDISEKTEHDRSTHLSPNQLVDVLKHNCILAEVKYNDEEATPSEPKFIIPAVLKHASEEELIPPTSLQASPLMIRFEGGFLPFGVFSASIARLIARSNSDSLSPTWRLRSKEVKKNKVKFLVDKAFVTTLISRPQYLEIQIEKYPGAICKHTLAQICSTVRQTVVETLETTISKMRYRPLDSIATAKFLSDQRPFHLAFTCCLDSHSDHLMKVDKGLDGEGLYSECLRDCCRSVVKSDHLLWFTSSGQSAGRGPQPAMQQPVMPQPAMPQPVMPQPTMQRPSNPDGIMKAPIHVWPWTEYEELYVEFWNVGLLAYWTINNGQPMNTDTILHYANTWSDMGGGKIPRFVEAKGGKAPQIRVSFNDNHVCDSRIGMEAQDIPALQPTMNLDLHTDDPSDEFKKHVIIRMFGHALGLSLEHRRPIFWKYIREYIDTSKMKNDLRATEEKFAQNWAEDDAETGRYVKEYDPDSIMHNWFRVEWLTHGYSDKKKIKRDRDSGILSKEVAKALLGVHKRRYTLAEQPSYLDIQLLREVYGNESVDTGDSGENNTGANTVELAARADLISIEHQQAPGGAEYAMVDRSARKKV